MNFITQKINGLQKRWKSLSYGIVYRKDAGFAIPAALRVNGRKKQFNFGDVTSSDFIYEFTEICLNDCYRLADLKKRLPAIKTVVDIGANRGLFTLAARQNFPGATITCYEPNRELESILNFNAAALEATVFYEAVTKEHCTVTLDITSSDLHTRARPATGGQIPGTAFKTLVARAGGKIDILKMDCEGAEWDLLEDTASWANIHAITMEYHLWAKPGSTAGTVTGILNSLGFTIISHSPLSEQFGLITGIKAAQANIQ
jgi:FkbM family methyltransferase